MMKDYDSDRRVHVLVNAIHANSGGGVTYLRAILPRLADNPLLFLTLLIQRHQRRLFESLVPCMRVHALDLPRSTARLVIWEQVSLPRLARRIRADVIFSPANFGSLLIRNQVTVLHNDVTVGRFDPRIKMKLYWAALSVLTLVSSLRVRRIIAVSTYASEILSFGCGRLLEGKIKVAHHGVFEDFRHDPAIARENFLLTVSDVYVQKNLLTLVRALALLPGMELRVAGAIIDAWYYRRILELAERLGVVDRLHFLGRLGVDELWQLYSRCRAFVFSSTTETFGIPLIEAMACGAPVACSNAGAIPEIVGSAALLFNPLDAQSMAQVIGRLIRDDDLRREMSARSLQRAREFSWQRAAETTAEQLIEAAHID